MNGEFIIKITIDILLLICILLIAISRYKTFQKSGLSGRGGIIPIYYDYLLFKVVGHKNRFRWIFIPPVFWFLKFIVVLRFSYNFGKNGWFAIGLWFLPEIFFPILAFGKSSFHNNAHISGRVRIILSSLLISIITCFCSFFVYSLYHSGEYPYVDNIRLPIQSFILDSISSFLVDPRGGFIITDEDDYLYEDPDTISRLELRPFIYKLQTGDILFTNSSKYISSIFIPGERKHTFVYVGNGIILDATSKGVSTGEFQDLDNLKRGSLLTNIIAFHPIFTEGQRNTFLTFLYSQIGKSYDFDYNDDSNESYYCAELVANALKQIGISISYETESIGKTIITPNDMVNFIKDIGVPSKFFDEVFSLKKEGICNKNKCNFDELDFILVDETNQ